MSLQSEVTSAMQLVFDTFKRDTQVIFYKSAKMVVVSQSNDFNADFGGSSYYTGISESGQSGSYDCRIIWPKQQDYNKYIDLGEAGISAKSPKGIVKIQMESGAYEYFQDTKAVFVNGKKYIPHGDIRHLGALGSINFFEFIGIKDT